jgi:hypothetical protein
VATGQKLQVGGTTESCQEGSPPRVAGSRLERVVLWNKPADTWHRMDEDAELFFNQAHVPVTLLAFFDYEDKSQGLLNGVSIFYDSMLDRVLGELSCGSEPIFVKFHRLDRNV